MSETGYRRLRDGEALEIGDEYLSQGKWAILSEDAYEEWVTAASHYNEDEMPPFRRPLDKDPALVRKTIEIFHHAASNMMAMLAADLGRKQT